MSSEIVVNVTGRETRVALLESGRLAELHIDRGQNRGFVGNVYLGRVVRVLPGMQAAFVDIGLERAAFLYVGDIFADFLEMPNGRPGDDDQPSLSEEDEPDLTAEGSPRAVPRAGQPAIQDLVKEGQEIVVQVAKDPIGTKGARVTTHITLPGRYLVFMPTVAHVGISRRIEREKERRRLRAFIDRHRPPGGGFIVRTVCAHQPDSVLEQDMQYLLRTWERIQRLAREKKAPAPLHLDYGLLIRFVRDHVTGEVRRIVVDDKEQYDQAVAFMAEFMPELRDRVQLYRGGDPVFDVFGVERQIISGMGRKVWLKSGGYLVIDQTEALVAIDINSGKFVGSSSLEETTTAINVEAVQEIVHQLRLRNIGGIIVIDFIDMDKESNREKVYRALEEEVKHDRARTNILKISELGLVQMTRKRVQEDFDRFVSSACPCCQGNGVLRSPETLAFDVLREVQRQVARHPDARDTVFVNANPAVADVLYNEELATLEDMEGRLGRRLVVRAMPHYHQEKFEVYAR